MEQILDTEETTLTISCHALAGISTPRTLKIEGYLKKQKVTTLIYFGSIHNFINKKVFKQLNLFIYLTPEFKVMVSNGKTIDFLGKCHNIKLTMG